MTRSEKEIFFDALEIDSVERRDAFIRQRCGQDAELFGAVNALIKQHENQDNPVDHPIVESGALSQTQSLRREPQHAPGTMVGPYKLMEQIGEGGFGQVFVAEQREPVRRRVALKIIKPGMESREVIGRFEAERQAIAMMDHPNIAKIFDAGFTENAQPYFVMELVRGVPLNTFCDDHKLGTRERLGLFVSICHALQHAHQKGIIHRDLKPSNVLVTMQDGKPLAKVIDFGIAKAIGQSLTGKTIYTRFASMIGTPAYMSPEQAEMSSVDIDTRSDIYSLGVLLYELLTGSTPFSENRLQSVGFDELRRIIREEEPPRPSARLSTLNAEAISTVATNRRQEPSRLTTSIKGDLDWIVMKALDKDRGRRYATAGAFSDDISRYLAEQPVDARPPSTRYRLSKFAKRNKVAITTVSLVVGTMIIGTAVSLWQTHVAIRALGEAQVAEDELSQFADRLKRANVMLSVGRAHADAGQWPDAYAAYTRATETQPKYFHVWVERASLYTRLGLWELAAEDYAKAVEVGWPVNGPESQGVPQLLHYAGKMTAYEEICEQLSTLENDPFGAYVRGRLVGEVSPEEAARFAGLTDARLPPPPNDFFRGRGRPGPDRGPGAERGPGPERGPGREPPFRDPPRGGDGFRPLPPRDPDRLGRGLERPARGPERPSPDRPSPERPSPERPRQGQPFSVEAYVSGWAHLRAGEFRVAIERLERVSQIRWPSSGIEQPLLAIAYHHAGQPSEALAACDAADRALDGWLNHSLDQSEIRPAMPWFDWIEFLINHRRATILVRGHTPTPDPRFEQLKSAALAAIE